MWATLLPAGGNGDGAAIVRAVQVAEGTASAIRLFVEADAAKANKKNKRQKTDGKKARPLYIRNRSGTER